MTPESAARVEPYGHGTSRADRAPDPQPASEFTRGVSFPDPSQIRIYDETLRDGEQMPGVCYTPAQKLEIAQACSPRSACTS